MTKYNIRIETKKGEVEKILEELSEAQEKIYDCYSRLLNLGVLTFSEAEKTTSEGE